MQDAASTVTRIGRISGANYGAQIRALVEQFGIIDQQMASLDLRGRIIADDSIVRYTVQKLVREKVVLRSSKRYYGHHLYYLPGSRAKVLGHNYRVAKLAHYLIALTPPGKSASLTPLAAGGVRPDAVLTFSGEKTSHIYLEYQTKRESWTTPRKILQYIRSHGGGLKIFFIERADEFLLEMARYAADGGFCFAHPDAILATLAPWTDPLFYFGGGENSRLPLLKAARKRPL